MPTHSKTKKAMMRQAIPVAASPAPAPEIPAPAPPEPAPTEPLAQYEGTWGDKVFYVIWLTGAGLLLLHFLCDTIFGQIF